MITTASSQDVQRSLPPSMRSAAKDDLPSRLYATSGFTVDL
jgi:hypothetical protein